MPTISTIPSLERVNSKTLFDYMRWEQGEHVAIIAPTGRGKTVCARALCWQRDWVAWCSTKKSDSEYDRMLEKKQYERQDHWPIKKPPRDQRYQRALIWPHYKRLLDVYKMGTPVFKKLLEDVYEDEGWTVVLDDLFFLSEELKLRKEITAINYQVRSLKVSLVSAMQRPKKIPLETWDQSSHLFLRPIGNYDDLMTLRGKIGRDLKQIQVWMGQLHEYEWIYFAEGKQPVIWKPPLERISL
jgi:hypothetical protein